MISMLLSHFSRVQLCVTPQTAAHQAPLSLGFSRQEHWSGLPFPFPVHEREKWKWSHLVMSDSLWPHGLQSTRLLRPWDFPGKSTGVGCHWIVISENVISCVWLFAIPWTVQCMEFSKPEYRRGSLFLLQGVFPTQGSNSGLPHCRWILYQLSHQGSPCQLFFILS